MINNMDARRQLIAVLNDDFGNYDSMHILMGSFHDEITDNESFTKVIKIIKAGKRDGFMVIQEEVIGKEKVYNLATIDVALDKHAISIINDIRRANSFINNSTIKDTKGELTMTTNNNNNTMVVSNSKEFLSLMTIKFDKFAMSIGEEGKTPKVSIVVTGSTAKVIEITMGNFRRISRAITSGDLSIIDDRAKAGMFFSYTAVDNVFAIRLTVNTPKTVNQSAPFTMDLTGVSKEDTAKNIKEAFKIQEELEKHVTQMTKDIVQEGMGLDVEDEISIDNVKENSDPNPWIFAAGQDNMVLAKNRRDELTKLAPNTGIKTAEQFMDVLAEKIIKPVVNSRKRLKIVTKKMNFFNVKKFNKDGSGREYKRVASPFIFEILDISQFVILSDVPNKDTLNSIMKNGFMASVQIGETIKGYDANGVAIVDPIMEERLFKYVATSASKQRQERYIFTAYTDREIIRKMLVFWSSDFDFGKQASIAKAESRVGQNLSTGICIGGAVPYSKRNEFSRSKYASLIEMYYIVIPDMTLGDSKLINGEVPVGHKAIKDADGKIIEEATGDFVQVLGDGSGLQNEALSKFAAKKLKIDSAVMLQHRLGKGTTKQETNINLGKLCKYLGIKVNLNLPIFFISESMWKFVPGIELLPVTILRTNEQLSERANMCYETWNALNISGPEGYKTLKELAQKEFDMFNLNTASDAGLIMHRLGTIAKMKDMSSTEDLVANDKDLMEDESLATSLFRFFSANPFYARRSEYLMLQVRMLFSRKIADMARGKLMVDGSFCIMMIDPGVWNGKMSLKAGQCYVGGRTGKCLLARYPMVYPGEPQVMEAIDVPEFAAFAGQNVIIMNVYDNAWEKMQGADFDGDACLVTFEASVIALAISGQLPIAPDMVKNLAPKEEIGWKNISEHFLTNFGLLHPKDTTYVPTIGKVNNIVASLLSAAHANGTFMSTETMDKVMHLALVINDLIDAAKTGIMPDLEHEYFDTYKLVPNYLSKSEKVGRGQFVNTWDTLTVDQDPDSIFYLDTKSPLGKLCNELVPELYKNFTLAGDKEFSVDDFIGMYDGTISVDVQSQVDGIRKEYISLSRAIFTEENNTMTEEERSDAYKSLVIMTNEKIRKVAAFFGNDIYTVGIACLISGGKRGFAFKCFEEGVIAVFEKMEGVTMCKAKNVRVAPANSVKVSYDGVGYYAQKRLSKEVQFDKFIACDIEKELTLRLVGLQYHDVTSMSDLKAKIASVGNIITGGRDTKDIPVAMANGKTIGKVSLTGQFSALSSFVMGGTAEVVAINFVMNNAERSMSYAEFMASKQMDAVIKSADLTVRYVVDGGDKTPSVSTAAEECTTGSVNFEVEEENAMMFGAGLADICGLEAPASIPVAQDDAAMPDANFMSLMDSYCFE